MKKNANPYWAGSLLGGALIGGAAGHYATKKLKQHNDIGGLGGYMTGSAVGGLAGGALGGTAGGLIGSRYGATAASISATIAGFLGAAGGMSAGGVTGMVVGISPRERRMKGVHEKAKRQVALEEKSASYQSFADEITKISAIIDTDVRKGTPVTNDFSAFKKLLKPGDIIITKPSDKNPSDLGSMAQTVSKMLYNNDSRWVHSGIYAGKGKLTHTQESFDEKAQSYFGTPFVQTQKIDIVPTYSDALIVRPDVPAGSRNKAVQNMQRLKGVAYSKIDTIRAALFPAAKDSTDKGIPRL